MSDNRETVYYVKEGRMCSARILGHMDFNVEATTTESGHKRSLLEIAGRILCSAPSDIPDGVNEMIERPGRWYLVSGMDKVHADDCFPTREEAAQAHYNKLMGVDE